MEAALSLHENALTAAGGWTSVDLLNPNLLRQYAVPMQVAIPSRQKRFWPGLPRTVAWMSCILFCTCAAESVLGAGASHF